MKKLLVLLLLILLVCPVSAQKEKILVQIEHSGTDRIGKALVFSLKEKLRKSTKFEYTSRTDVVRLKIEIHSIKIPVGVDYETTNILSAYASILLIAGIDSPLSEYVTSSIGICGENRIDGSAMDIIMELDDWTDWFEEYD